MVLEIKDLTKEFGGFVAVDDIDFVVNEGEFKSLIGPNGAGKTTTFNLISGALTPTSGTILFQDEDVTEYPPEKRTRLGMGRSFQITNLFPEFTVKQNLRVPLHSIYGTQRNFWSEVDKMAELDSKVDEVIDYVDLDVDRDEKVSTLSHGEKRQLELAVTLACQPELLLLDEPSAGLSRSELSLLQDLLEKIKTDYTVLLVEHNMDLVMDISDTITVLSRGSILVEGEPSQVRENSDVQSVYLGSRVD